MDCVVETNAEISETPTIVIKNSSIICQEEKAEMEAAVWLLGVLEVVVTQHKLQRPGGVKCSLRTPLENDLINFFTYSMLCFSLIITNVIMKIT